jgi:hypothetical protein
MWVSLSVLLTAVAVAPICLIGLGYLAGSGWREQEDEKNRAHARAAQAEKQRDEMQADLLAVRLRNYTYEELLGLDHLDTHPTLDEPDQGA